MVFSTEKNISPMIYDSFRFNVNVVSVPINWRLLKYDVYSFIQYNNDGNVDNCNISLIDFSKVIMA